jgi:membrane-bound lytic murein transglycosylase D
MYRFQLVHLILPLCFLSISAPAVQGQVQRSSAAISSNDSNINDTDSVIEANSRNLSSGILDLMNVARSKYREGSSLIKAGDAEKSRQLFNEAVDAVLQSNWDLTSTPALNKFFQDLIQRIHQDESLYLLGPNENDDHIEAAVIDDLEKMDLIPIKIDSSLQDDLFSDLAKTKYEIPITVNDKVVKSLDFWLNSGRKFFIDGLLRSGKYRPLIEKVFREESIPIDLMYLAQVESLFKTHAVSKANAKGIWQFEKDTAILYGLKVNRDVDERSDPEKSTRAAARYLKDLFATFKDWNLALAAYNWGEGKVQRLIDSTGLKDFWQLVDLRRRLPEETKNHIPLIQASVILAKNPEKYGLPTKLDPPLKYSEVFVSKPIDLQAAAKILGTTLDELKKLNPALKGSTTPANYPNYKLKVPAGIDAKLHEQLNSLPVAVIKPAPEYRSHKVKSGETLAKIAERYNVSVKDLEKANSLNAKGKLVIGTVIKVPAQTKSAVSRESKSSPENKLASPHKKSGSVRVSAKKATSNRSQGNAGKGKAGEKEVAKAASIR